MEITVVGGGLGGLAAAIAAARAGHTVTVLERAPALRENGAGIGLLPNAVLALDELGLGVAVRERAAPAGVTSGLRDRTGRALIGADQQAVTARVGAPLVVVPRVWLHRLLAGAASATVRTGVTVTDPAAVGGDVVIAADGAHSMLRAALFPTHPGLTTAGEQAARGIAPRAPSGIELVSGEFLDHRTGERTGCLPMSDGAVYWYATWREAVVGAAPTDPAGRLRWIADRRADWHPGLAPTISASLPDDVHVTETTQLATPLPRLATGRVALVGDAAHAMTPDLGQGGGQAFEDAVALQDVLQGANPATVESALADYSARRLPRTTAMIAASRRANRMLVLRGPRGRLRDVALRMVPVAVATEALARQLRTRPV